MTSFRIRKRGCFLILISIFMEIMSVVDTMEVRGIRSYDPDNPVIMEFQSLLVCM